MKHLSDITAIDWSEVEPVDVVTGGSPCQDLSVAGKRAGLAGERSGLFMEQIRCVKELRKADEQRGRTAEFIRPRYMVWENVPGAFSSGRPKGADFAAVIEEIIKVAEPRAAVSVCVPNGGWTKSGCYYAEDGSWSIAWRVHDAQFWGVPQRRKRIALVADFGGLSAPEILFERKGLRGDFEESGETRKGAAGTVGGGVDGAISFQERAGCPEGGKGILIQNERTGALSTVNNQRVCYGISSYDSNAMKSSNPNSGIYEAETSRTLDLNGGNPACNQGGIAVVEPIPINTMLATRDKALGRGTGLGVGKSGDAQFTISAAHSHAVCCFEPRSQDGTPRIHEGVASTFNTAQGGQRQPCVVMPLVDLEDMKKASEHSEPAEEIMGGVQKPW